MVSVVSHVFRNLSFSSTLRLVLGWRKNQWIFSTWEEKVFGTSRTQKNFQTTSRLGGPLGELFGQTALSASRIRLRETNIDFLAAYSLLSATQRQLMPSIGTGNDTFPIACSNHLFQTVR